MQTLFLNEIKNGPSRDEFPALQVALWEFIRGIALRKIVTCLRRLAYLLSLPYRLEDATHSLGRYANCRV